jgi:hypothetical protein
MGSIPADDTVYLLQSNSSAPVQYKVGIAGTPTTVSWPCTLVNNQSSGVLIVVFPTALTLNALDQYFFCGSDNIQFGITSVNPNGSRPVITIDNVPTYTGLIQNTT